MGAPSMAPIELLLVEDNLGDVRLTVEALRDGDLPHRLHVAGTGEAALAFLRHEGRDAAVPRPDLVLLDLGLPGLDGRAVLRAVRDDPTLRAIPVALLVSSEADWEVVAGEGLPTRHHLTKPLEVARLHVLLAAIEAEPSVPATGTT